MMLIGLSCLLFGIGLFGVLVAQGHGRRAREHRGDARRSAAAARRSRHRWPAPELTPLRVPRVSKESRLLVLVVVAAEAAVGLALLVAVARKTKTTALDDLTEVNG